MVAKRQFLGALHPDTKVKILPSRGECAEVIKIGNLEPGNYLESAFDSSFWRIDEVVTTRRNLTAYKLTLEDGETIVLAEDTIVCGQYGPKEILKEIEEEHCIIDLGFHDSESRRRFIVELKGELVLEDKESVSSLFGKSKKKHPNSKSFYYYTELLSFLEKLRRRNPCITLIWGCRVSHPYEGYSFGELPISSIFFPFVPLAKVYEKDTEYDLAYLARKSRPYGYEYSRVIEMEQIDSLNTWVFPIYDSHKFRASNSLEWQSRPYNRYAFLASKTPIIFPNDFISFDVGKYTIPATGMPVFPTPKPKKEYFEFSELWSLLEPEKADVDLDTELLVLLKSLKKMKTHQPDADEVLKMLKHINHSDEAIDVDDLNRA